MKQKNALIVLCGMDGTGKSTLASELVSFFKKQKKPVAFIHGHGYAVSQNSFALDEKKVILMRKVLGFFWPLALLDNYITYAQYKKQLRQTTIVCDRYFYDKVARLLFYGVINRFIATLFLHLLPKPDYAFILTADPQTVSKRKKEYTVKENEIFKKNYEFISQKLHIPLINTEKTKAQSFEEILSIVQKNEIFQA